MAANSLKRKRNVTADNGDKIKKAKEKNVRKPLLWLTIKRKA